VRGGAIGALKTFSSDATIRVQDPDDVRLQRRLGGGTVYDLGVAAIFVARTVFDAEPAQVMAMTARMTRRYGATSTRAPVALIRFPDDRLGAPAHVVRRGADVVLTGSATRARSASRAPTRRSARPRSRSCAAAAARRCPSSPPIRSRRSWPTLTSVLRDIAPEPSGIEGLTDVPHRRSDLPFRARRPSGDAAPESRA